MPEKMTLHYKDGSTTSMDAIDARRVLREHASEWATSAFPSDVQKATQEDAEALRLHLARLRADGKTEVEVEKARHAWTGVKKSAPAAEAKGPFEARVKGSGWWAIYDADGKQVGKNIREPEGISFNAMSEEDKAEYVKAETAED
jgi:hypothetical protein